MINYLKSEHYRLLRKKSLYIISGVCFLLIAAAAVVLYLSQKYDPNFPYGSSAFFYMNVISGIGLILIVAFLFNMALTGKDMSIMKQSISFGVSKHIIFWSKLLLTLSYFLLICLIGILLMIGLGERLLVNEEPSILNFLIAVINMLPIVLSGFCLIHMLKMLRVSGIYVIITLLFIYGFSGDLLRIMLQSVSGLDELYQYAPSTLLEENLMNFMNYTIQFDYRYWMVGVGITVITLLIGATTFVKQDIDY